jgi:hypothetical protein
VFSGRSDTVVPLRSERGYDAHLTKRRLGWRWCVEALPDLEVDCLSLRIVKAEEGEARSVGQQLRDCRPCCHFLWSWSQDERPGGGRNVWTQLRYEALEGLEVRRSGTPTKRWGHHQERLRTNAREKRDVIE